MPETDAPFPEAVQTLLDEREWSLRELTRTTLHLSEWGSVTTISYLVRGMMPPSATAMEAIARAFNVAPTHFAEYRLLLARRALDPNEVGLPRALESLARCPELRR